MKIKKLRLRNFGIYAGRQEIDFSATTESKPIVLIGGYNGRGKTTILEAILLCLYGKRSYVLSGSQTAYNKYLSKYINQNDATFEASVELVMSAEVDSLEAELSVIRRWNERDKSVREEHMVLLNGKFDEILTDDWDSQMDCLMPIGMSRFFLFDGEKVSELADDFSEEKLKQAIKTLLGIDVIERLNADLTTIIGKNKVAKEIESNDNEAKRLQTQKNSLQSELNSVQQTIEVLRLELEHKTKRLEECERSFSSSGGTMFGKQETTIQKRASIERKFRTVQSEIYEKLSGAAPLLMVLPLLERASDTAKIERDCEVLNYEINGVEQIFRGLEIPKKLQTRFNNMKANRQRLMNSVNGNVLSLSPAGTDLLLRLCGSFPTDELENLEKLLDLKNGLQEQLQGSDYYLAVELDTQKLNKLVAEMKSLNQDITRCQVLIEQLESDIASKMQTLISVNSSLERLTAQLLLQYESNDNSVRMVRYSIMAKTVLGQYSQRIQFLKAGVLSDKVTEKFHAIIGKRRLIQRISFNPSDLSMELFDENGNLFNRKQLSAGEQQLLSTAIVWGIVECTGQEFPMIIDTPLARLDSTHREHFVDNYIPNAAKQVIIFSTDAEITNKLQKRIDRFVAKKYLLHYEEATNSTVVKEGYFT
ncbi:hypothetical protein FACS1894202_06880 [Clostridia bacterium]|nr:hypothetical protein FACS1894202_06880 [Clostridia bacterium]